jgi:pyruvate dehydrogenase E2 component (dihydrolipoamide acetyltransferase)
MEAVTEPQRVPLSRMRKAIARSMTASALIPQFTVEADANLSALAELRAQSASDGAPFSVSDVFTSACARALVEHPELNASFDGDAIVRHAEVNVGIAIGLDDGLVAPAIRNADRLDLDAIAAERLRLTESANAGRLTPEEILSPTFTVSNLGPLGIRRFRALVVPPQAAILAVGKVTEESLCSLSLSCDHRVLDGVPAARFLTGVIELLEEPLWLAVQIGG